MASFFEEEYSNLEDKFKKKVEQDKVAADPRYPAMISSDVSSVRAPSLLTINCTSLTRLFAYI